MDKIELTSPTIVSVERENSIEIALTEKTTVFFSFDSLVAEPAQCQGPQS